MATDLDLRIHKLGCAARVLRTVLGQPELPPLEGPWRTRSQAWREECEIVSELVHGNYEIHVKHGDWWLRQSGGPHQRHRWDVYGDDYRRSELVLLAIATAPPPPDVLATEVCDGR